MNRQQAKTEIGQRITFVRHERELTQEQLAKRVRLSRTSITNIEAGRQQVSIWGLMTLAEALQVSAYIFLLPTEQWLDDIEEDERRCEL